MAFLPLFVMPLMSRRMEGRNSPTQERKKVFQGTLASKKYFCKTLKMTIEHEEWLFRFQMPNPSLSPSLCVVHYIRKFAKRRNAALSFASKGQTAEDDGRASSSKPFNGQAHTRALLYSETQF